MGKSLNIRVFLITMAQNKTPQVPKTPTKTEFLQLKGALKSWKYRTREGRRFAKYLYLASIRLIRRPVDVVGVILSEFTTQFEVKDIVGFAKDLRDILRIWTTWLEFFKIVDTVYVIRKEVYMGEVKLFVEMDIEDRYWVFSVTITEGGIRTRLEYFDVA